MTVNEYPMQVTDANGNLYDVFGQRGEVIWVRRVDSGFMLFDEANHFTLYEGKHVSTEDILKERGLHD